LPASTSIESTALIPHRVLLYVEDEEAAVFLFEIALRELGCDIQFHRVADGEAAIAFLAKRDSYSDAPTPGLVLLDLNLPKVSGFEVLAHLQANADLNAIPVVIFTSSARPADRVRSLSLGARKFITKPASLDSFIDVVRSVSLMVPKSNGNAS
jgi:CheY-like chemotaxis protein